MATSLEESENASIKTSGEDEVMEISENEEHKIKLADLKVTDLKVELEKRELDKNGVKSVLVERLKNALVEAGEDPEEFTFKSQPDSVNSKSPVKKMKIPDSETNGGVDSKEDSAIEINETDTIDEIADETSVEVKETDVCSEDVKETSVGSEDKNINEVTLQISIDEEDAQLNEDEVIEISKVSDNEIDVKMEEEPSVTSNCEDNVESAAEEVPIVENSPSKTSKPVDDDTKDKKITKTTASSKTPETTTTVCPKVLKVIGKNDKIKNASVLAKSLWITGLPSTTRAADLKSLFSKQGRVLSVKIVKSTKQTPVKSYGFVTMATSKDATKAIQNLHRTELNGRTISVERTQKDPSALLKKSESKQAVLSTKKVLVKKEVTKAAESGKSTSEPKATTKVDTKAAEAKPAAEPAKVKEEKTKASEKSKSKERDQKSRERKDRDTSRKSSVRKDRSRPFASNERPRFTSARRSFGSRPMGRSRFGTSGFRPRQETSIYERMREERIRRDRIRDRERREAERRRLEEIEHHKFIERKQREEAYRLEREKEKLRIEREQLERERAEMLKMEREKQRLERERLEREREELRRVAELRRVVPPSTSSKRPFARSSREADVFLDYRKKANTRFEDRSSFHTEKARIEPATSNTRYAYPTRERETFTRQEFERRPTERFAAAKTAAPAPRADFGDRDSRREVTIRERPAFDRSDFRDRDSRRSFPARERSTTTSRRETTRDDWKHDRRVQDRSATASTSNSTQRRTNYY